MPDRIALKQLASSDLTFFEALYHKAHVTNQKSINLNADVFIQQFYPGLPELGDAFTISLTILGPNGSPPYLRPQGITKGEGYKNWRLNGVFVPDPEGEPGRFDKLVAKDLAILSFVGDPIPQSATLVLISASSSQDAILHARLTPLIPGGRRTMVEVSRAQLAAAAAGVAPIHPVWLLAADPEYDAALEDAALGGAKGIEALAAKPTRPVSAKTLAAAKAAAEKNGRDGEALAWIHLKRLQEAGKAAAIQWASRPNAVSPFDFSATIDGAVRKIDAKSTSGDFDRPVHMSLSELKVAAESEHYDLWRVYLLDEDGARLKIAHDIASTAKTILAGLSMPAGVTVDGVAIDPGILKWSDEEYIQRPDDDADE